MRKVGAVVLLLLLDHIARGANQLILENKFLQLSFDQHSGEWVGFTDRETGEQLVTGKSFSSTAVPTRAVNLDQEQLRRAVAEGNAISLSGDWLYTPMPLGKDDSTQLVQGEHWATASIPSRHGSGGDRLYDWSGDFRFRKDCTIPTNWPNQSLALVFGSLDDFDVAWLNGTHIGGIDEQVSHPWEMPRFYRFESSLLRRGQTNTLIVKVTNPARDGGIGGPIALGFAAKLPTPEAISPLLTKHSSTHEGHVQRLQTTVRDGPFEYRSEFALAEKEPRFTRQLEVKNLSDKALWFETANYCTPPLRLGDEQAVIFPGSLPVGDTPVKHLREGESLRSRSEDPLVVLWDHRQGRGLGAWFHSEEEFAPVSVRREGNGCRIRHRQYVIVHLQPGESIKLGRQFFWLVHGTRDKALASVQAVYRAIDLHAPTNHLAGLGRMVMYCGHPGGPPELNFLKYGGFNALRAYLPTLRKLNIDLLWLLPIWEHGDGTKWNLYSPFTHFQVDHLQGSADDLKELAHDCATNQIHLLFDLVPHGPPEFTPLAKEHPEWIALKPDGSNQIEWEQLAFDNNHPGWQDYMRCAAEWGAHEFHAVGARVDCGAGGPLNWNPLVTQRPSLSSLAAGLGMNRAIRDGYLRAGKEAVVLPEEHTGASIYYRVADLTYDAQLYYLQYALLDRNPPPEQWARQFQQFLHDQQLVSPPGALRMRWISNHDTVSWTFQAMRPVKSYGLERMRALLALCAFIDGVPMLYQGDEDPAIYGGQGESSVDFLARIYGLRKQLLSLREGAAQYASTQASHGVFSCLRQARGQSALVLISFNPADTQTTVMTSMNLLGEWVDQLSNERFKCADVLRVPLRAYQARVLTQANPTVH